MLEWPLQENYNALAVAIYKVCTVEQAFRLLDNPRAYNRLTEEDLEDMRKLKNEFGYKLKELGEIYGIDNTQACKLLRGIRR